MKAKGFAVGFTAGVVAFALAASVSVFATSGSKEAENTAIAIEFYNRALNQKDWEKARELIGDRYIQHNPAAVDGLEGIKNHVAMLKEKFPQNHGELKRSIAQGDLVALHMNTKRTPDSRGYAVVDIFRIEKGKVIEHWDVVQDVPEKALNDNTMF